MDTMRLPGVYQHCGGQADSVLALALSEAPAFLNNHVLMVFQEHPAIVHIEHAQWLGLHRGTACRRDPVGLVAFQQALKGRKEREAKLIYLAKVKNLVWYKIRKLSS